MIRKIALITLTCSLMFSAGCFAEGSVNVADKKQYYSHTLSKSNYDILYICDHLFEIRPDVSNLRVIYYNVGVIIMIELGALY